MNWHMLLLTLSGSIFGEAPAVEPLKLFVRCDVYAEYVVTSERVGSWDRHRVYARKGTKAEPSDAECQVTGAPLFTLEPIEDSYFAGVEQGVVFAEEDRGGDPDVGDSELSAAGAKPKEPSVQTLVAYRMSDRKRLFSVEWDRTSKLKGGRLKFG